MNPAMWSHPATVAAVDKLKQWGVHFIAVGEGRTACGEVGEGRLAEPMQIVAAIEASFARPAKRLRVLVTSGGTSEPIDGVRVLTNTSTGRTGAGLASYLARSGHEVVLLRARTATTAEAAVREEIFSSFADLDVALKRLLSSEYFDAVVHAAAVSDFGVEAVVSGGVVHQPRGAKLESGPEPVSLRLAALPKLVDSLRSQSRNPQLTVVAFKLTAGAAPAAVSVAVETLLKRSTADLVVHNDLADRNGGENFPACIYQRDGGAAVRCETRSDLAVALEQLLVARGKGTG